VPTKHPKKEIRARGPCPRPGARLDRRGYRLGPQMGGDELWEWLSGMDMVDAQESGGPRQGSETKGGEVSALRGDGVSRYEFTLILEGPDILTDDGMDALFDAGCDDATFGAVDGQQYADFTREGDSLAAAVGSAIRQIEDAIPGLMVRRVEPDDLVTASEIARRTARSRESVRLLIAGERGRGRFPAPISNLKGRRLWRWADVAQWLTVSEPGIARLAADAGFIAALNAALEIRRHGSRLSSAQERSEVARFLRTDTKLLESA
jgi:hypothetical protein